MSAPENAALVLPWLLRGKAMAHLTNHDEAVAWLNQSGAHRAARIMQKANVPATSTVDSDTAVMYGAWSQSMATASIFYKLLNEGFFRKFAMYQRNAFFTSSPTADVNLEGHSAPISRAVIGDTVLRPWMIASNIVVTREMLFDPGSEAAFNKELKAISGQRVDAALVAMLFDGTGSTTIPSSGMGVEDAVNDVRAALLALGTVGDASRVVWLMAPDVARRASALGADGGGVFPSMTPAGGQLRGVNALVSNGIPAGQAMLLDAAQIGAADGAVGDTSGQADIEMRDDPTSNVVTPTGTSLVSMFQTNSIAMRLVATIAAARLSETAGAVLLEGIQWGGA